MDTSQNFNILEVDTLKTNKLDYSYSNNILDITLNNCKTLQLNNSHSDYILNTKDYNMDINIELTSQKIGTKHRILITNKQKSLRIHCKYVNDKFKGSCKINNNSNTINNEILKNNLTKKIININDGVYNDIIFIPISSLGLYNGGYIDLVYIGNNNCNIPITNQVGYWCVSGNLIGDIKVPKSIVGNSSIKMILTLYLLNNENKKKIICATTKHPTTNEIYFNNVENNNISLFLNSSYIIQIFDIETSLIVYNSETYDSSDISDTTNLYNIKINKNLYLNTSGDGFISLKNQNTADTTKNTLSFLNEFDRTIGIGTNNATDFNIQPLYNKTITDYKKLNIIQYKIEKSDIEIISGFFNIIDINAYNNIISNTVTLPNILMGKYNIFTDVENKIGVGTIYDMY